MCAISLSSLATTHRQIAHRVLGAGRQRQVKVKLENAVRRLHEADRTFDFGADLHRRRFSGGGEEDKDDKDDDEEDDDENDDNTGASLT